MLPLTVRKRGEPRRRNARDRTKHTAKHLPPAESSKTPAETITAREVNNFALFTVYGLNNGTVCPRQGRRRPAPRFCVAGADGVTTVQMCVGGGVPAAKVSANDSNLSKVLRREG
jgi:hypothetical protein